MGCTPSSHDDVEPITLMPGARTHSQFLVALTDTSETMGEVGGALQKQKELQNVISKGRHEIKQAQEKLNSSLTTPLAESELRVIEKGTWLNEVKDVTRRFNTLPPIAQGNKVKKNAMSFVID